MPRKSSNECESSGVMYLCDVPIGQKARIMELCLPLAAQEYLMRLGFVPGTEVEVVRRGPLKGPAIYRVQGTDTAVRYEVAHSIRAEMSPGDDAE